MLLQRIDGDLDAVGEVKLGEDIGDWRIPTEKGILQPSIKFAVPLKPEEALSLAVELTTIAQVAERRNAVLSFAQNG